MRSARVLLAGGGSAGHTSPMIATADALLRLEPETQIWCLGTARGLETRVIPEAGYRLELIPPVPLPRRLGLDLLKVPARLWAAVRAARRVIRETEADVVVGFGGYVAMPAYLAATMMRVPVVIHEGNALPGLANRLGALATKRVATSFPDTRLPHATFIGLPLRRGVIDAGQAIPRAEAARHFGLEPDLPCLLVTGGSQGAASINETVAAIAPQLAAAGVQVLHVTGPKGSATPARRPEPAPPYVVVPFVDDMRLAYAVADATICRSGANSVTEAAVLGIPAVFVPLPIGNGEQRLNALPVVDAGGALLVSDGDFTPEWAAETLPALLRDPERLRAMGSAARGLMPADADEALARMVLEAVGA